ncbi:MAG TPA: hypothetical protein VG267_18680 [Terracidiphilus sp.]|jgi:hypothetical protein|nr:hypothetical protein [Terracidiphilus sp.]
MNLQAASVLVRGNGDGRVLVPIFLVISAVSIAAAYWKSFVQWIRGIRGRDWATVTANIDVVSVTPEVVQSRGGERIAGYLATLTYFYRNPELQMGEYSRSFSNEADANSWAESYKGRSVMVHIDPSDTTRSVLRRQEL